MKVFLISSSIVENSLIYNLDYLLGRSIDEIVLLRENHTVSEYTKFLKNKITLSDTISSAIISCNVAIIIAPPNARNRQFEFIFDYVKSRVFETYYIDLSTVCCNGICDNTYLKNIPTVLVLAVGKFHQVSNLELSLNEIFSLKKVAFKQFFSSKTAFLLKQFEQNKILNSEIMNSMHRPCIDIQIATLCCDNIEFAFNDLSLIGTVQDMNPSYVFFVSDNNLQDERKMIDAFQNRLNCHFNSILFSDYVSILWYETPTPILMTNKCHPYIKIGDKESVWNDIIKNIAFPEKIKVVRANR